MRQASFSWDDLHFWDTGEWDVVRERLADLRKKKINYCPSKGNLFKALDVCPFEKTKVIILGQDPYPDPELATGIAFDIPETVVKFPVTLQNLFKEYENDLHYPTPTSGSLLKWCAQGVLLWNVIPSCEEGKSLSHEWDEWRYLTKEILERATQRCIVVAALGSIAREHLQFVDTFRSRVVETSHPSPRGNLKSKIPFLGSRIYSTINQHLNELLLDPIDWKLT